MRAIYAVLVILALAASPLWAAPQAPRPPQAPTPHTVHQLTPTVAHAKQGGGAKVTEVQSVEVRRDIFRGRTIRRGGKGGAGSCST